MEHQVRLNELLARRQPFEFSTNPEELVLLSAQASNATQTLADAMGDSGGLYRWPADRDDFIGCVPSSELVSQGFQLGLPTLLRENVDQLPAGGDSLSTVQLDSIRKRGSFEVSSGVEGVPAHEWTLSSILVRGSEPAQRSWCLSLADWYESMAFTWPEFVVGKKSEGEISILDGFYELYAVMQDLCHVSCGGRRFERVNIQQAIEADLQRRQVEGLRPVRQHQNANSFPRKWEWQRDGEAGNWLALDFSLLAPEVQRMLRPRLDLLQNEVRRRHRQKLTNASVVGMEDDWVAEQWLDTQLEVMAELTSEFPRLAPQLVAISALASCRDSLQKRELRRRTEIEAEALAANPMRALSKKWRSQYVDQQLTVWRREVEHAADNTPFEHIPLSFALTQLRAKSSAALELDWWMRLLEIELKFRCSAEPRTIEATLMAARQFCVQERYALRIWQPSNWNVIEHTNVDGEVTHYSASKYEERIVHAGLGWRFHSFLEFTWSSAWNGCFYAIVAAMWGPTGMKALFSESAFYPDMKVNSETGEIETDKSVKMESFTSRLCNLWSAIADMRQRFEKAPDNGILSKGVMRPFHYLWVYGVCGGGGSTAIVVGQPVLTAITLAVSGVTLTTFVVWAPGAALVRWTAHVILYDPHEFGCMPLPRMVCRAAFGGIGRIAISTVAVVVLPIVATARFSAETIRFALRRVYDETVLNLVVKQWGRIPNADSFLARRTAGPGVSASCHYQVSPGVALAAMRAELELLEIDYIENELCNVLEKPVASFKRVLVAFLKPLRLSGEVSHPDLSRVEEDRARQKKLISEVMNDRRKELRSLWNFMGSKRHSIRLSAADLQRTLESASALAQQFATQRLLHRLDTARQFSFWDRWDLADGDWTGFGRAMLAKAFSAEFVEASLEDLDENGFHLEVTHPGLEKLLRAVYSTGNTFNTADIQAVVEPLLRVLPCAPQKTLKNTPGPAVANLSDLFTLQPRTPENALRALWDPDRVQPHARGRIRRRERVLVNVSSSDSMEF